VRKVPGFKSAGHAILVSAYVAVNLAVTFSEADFKSTAGLGHRFGWYVPSSLVSPAIMFWSVCL
jgi:hypothetical protein